MPSVEPHKGNEAIAPNEIECHLERVLSSPEFQTSQRSQEFLRFVVRRTLDGAEGTIKERTIAVEVFGRGPAYDSSEDSFVRVKAGEVRRRLARYYESRPAGDPLRIELPVGCYVPHFVRAELSDPVSATLTPNTRPPRRRLTLVAVTALLAAVGLTAVWWMHRPSAIEQFWQPIHDAPGSLVIFLPLPESYIVQGDEATRPFPAARIPLAGSSPPAFAVRSPDKVGVGAAQGAIRFVAQCVRTGKPYDIRTGEDFRFTDLRRQPCVIFGAFSSKWTVELNNEFRFRLLRETPSRIVDAQEPGQQWVQALGDYPDVPREDYAIAGRVISPKTGQLVIIAAGISTYGTQAAAEFLTDPARLRELAALAPGPLNRGNFQVLLHTSVIGDTPGPPQIVKTHFW